MTLTAENGHGPVTGCAECGKLRIALNEVLAELHLAEAETKRLQKRLNETKRAEKTEARRQQDYDTAETLYDYWREKCNHPDAKFGPKRKKAVLRALETYDPHDICLAIVGAAVAAFVDAKGVRHDDLELICRDEVKLESFIARYRRWKEQQT